MSTTLLFVDGLGIGEAAESNPLMRRRRSDPDSLFTFASDRIGTDGRLHTLPTGWEGAPLDAGLGIAGLPQSATGQATIFTGENAAAHLGRHQSAFPGGELRQLVTERSLLKRMTAAGRSVTFANAYGPSFPGHDAVDAPRRSSVTTLASWAAGLRFRTYDDLAAGRAVYHDITRWTTGKRGRALPVIDPVEAAAHLRALGDSYDWVVHEHFLLDLCGHGRIEASPDKLLTTLDHFVTSFVSGLNPAHDGVALVSDHGNVEDGNGHVHTANPVPFLRWGTARGPKLTAGDLTAVAPLLFDVVEAPCNGS